MNAHSPIQNLVTQAAAVIAPVWPIKTFIACNPLQGFEDFPIEQALTLAEHYKDINRLIEPGREAVNREMIKWLMAFLDDGQAIIALPNRAKGFYHAFINLARFDSHLCKDPEMTSWLANLPNNPEQAIVESFVRLHINASDQEEFIKQSLFALSGWSGYVKWNNDWRNGTNDKNPITMTDYVAVRLIITCALWPQAKVLTTNRTSAHALPNATAEAAYRDDLLQKILGQAQTGNLTTTQRPDAQLAFCIDVRSEPFRRALEATGNYETLGFAGFFGLPVRVKNYGDDEAHDSCPVLLKPCHEVHEHPEGHDAAEIRRHDQGKSALKLPKSFYQGLKYHFATPLALAEMLGPWLGLRALARTFLPQLTSSLKSTCKAIIASEINTTPILEDINLPQQADYAEGALRMMGLTQNLAPVIVFCGLGSTTHNNAYASALDCGACGGNAGGSNARILALILNKKDIRLILAARGLIIPDNTIFMAAQHDTTTDDLTLYDANPSDSQHKTLIADLKKNLIIARHTNAASRAAEFGVSAIADPVNGTLLRSQDWAQPRPEWGLARNAAFIVGPRTLTKNLNLQGRCFLHSYDWQHDTDGKFLQTILTAPMVVAQWINNQYLFSTLDNVSYGGGSKVTKNVIGKIGVMQGNASDLMHGLPLQSVYATDDQPYHEALRLLTIVYAPRAVIMPLIQANPILQKLFGNGWVSLACIDPSDNKAYLLQRDLNWIMTEQP
jgi:uncharacterized protein YbcC (UPF0753/DUF2309 family)